MDETIDLGKVMTTTMLLAWQSTSSKPSSTIYMLKLSINLSNVLVQRLGFFLFCPFIKPNRQRNMILSMKTQFRSFIALHSFYSTYQSTACRAKLVDFLGSFCTCVWGYRVTIILLIQACQSRWSGRAAEPWEEVIRTRLSLRCFKSLIC